MLTLAATFFLYLFVASLYAGIGELVRLAALKVLTDELHPQYQHPIYVDVVCWTLWPLIAGGVAFGWLLTTTRRP